MEQTGGEEATVAADSTWAEEAHQAFLESSVALATASGHLLDAVKRLSRSLGRAHDPASEETDR